MLQYRGNRSQLFGNKVRSITKAQIVSTARKLTIALPFLKSSFSRDLKSNVVYKLSCCGCNSSYARQTVQHLATKVEEHKKEDSSVGIHKRQYGEEATTRVLSWEIIDKSKTALKHLTLEALHITKLRPGINTRDEFRSRELTLRF